MVILQSMESLTDVGCAQYRVSSVMLQPSQISYYCDLGARLGLLLNFSACHYTTLSLSARPGGVFLWGLALD